MPHSLSWVQNAAYLIQSQAPQKIIASKRENNSKGEPSYRIHYLLHYLGCYKHCISPTEFSGSIRIYDDRVKHWFQCIALLYDLGFCSTVVGKFICLHFEKLVKYYSVQTRTEQIPFTVPVDPVHFKSMPLLFVLLPDSKDELWHSRQQSTNICSSLNFTGDSDSGICFSS